MPSFEDLPFLRGVSEKYDLRNPSVQVMRMDRKPKDSSPRFHAIADAWFARKFGVNFRSQSLHLTARILTAQTHGATPAHVMRVVPLSPYRYCWSPNAVDLLFAAKKMEHSSEGEIASHLESLNYQTDGLDAAFDSGNEVMLHCERYMAIPLHLLDGDFLSKSDESVILINTV